MDGDLFSGNAEGFTTFAVSPADSQGRFGIRFTCLENGRRFDWQDAVTVRKEGGRWVVDDVHFRNTAAYASGYGSRLRKALASPGCSR